MRLHINLINDDDGSMAEKVFPIYIMEKINGEVAVALDGELTGDMLKKWIRTAVKNYKPKEKQ